MEFVCESPKTIFSFFHIRFVAIVHVCVCVCVCVCGCVCCEFVGSLSLLTFCGNFPFP